MQAQEQAQKVRQRPHRPARGGAAPLNLAVSPVWLLFGSTTMSDAMQTVSIFVLRCYRVTLAPLLVYGVLLWGLGLAGGYLLAYRGVGPLAPQQSPAAFWQAGAGALLLTALVVQLMLRRASRRAVQGASRPA